MHDRYYLRTAYTADEQRKFPAELNGYSRRREPQERQTLAGVLLDKVIYDSADVPDEQYQCHRAVVRARRALYLDYGHVCTERLREHGRAEPPNTDERCPFEFTAVAREPQPYPNEVGKTVAHRHPQQHGEHIAALYRPRSKREMKNPVIDDKIQYAARKPEQQRKIFLFPYEHRAQPDKEHYIQIDIQRVEHALRDDLRSR